MDQFLLRDYQDKFEDTFIPEPFTFNSYISDLQYEIDWELPDWPVIAAFLNAQNCPYVCTGIYSILLCVRVPVA